jgi:uncharacterized protein involved in outer membrane biogenesis
MNNLLIAIAVFIITVVGALFAVPHFIDWNSYRGLFEQEAKSVIGREVEVDGDVKLHLLPTPYFRLEKVRIADTSANLTFFKTESLSIKLSIPPLFRGIVEAHEIEFERPVLHLALDAKGGWNWQSFAQALGDAGYVPANVALTSLRIRDGVLAFHGSDGVEHARLAGLNGELSAPALAGPYRFRGDFGAAGAKREIRLSTGVPEADGTVPFRVSVRLPDASTYVLDARAVDLMGRSRIKGGLTARLPFWGRPARYGRVAPRAPEGPEEETGSDGGEAFELKAAIEVDAASARLSDLTLAFEQGGRPQIIAGTVRASWHKALDVEMELSSRWLDLDRLVGTAESSAPIDGIAGFAAWARELLPADGRARARLSIDQANLGGEPVGPVRLRLAQSVSKLEIEELRAGLPGGTSGELKGDIAGPADALAFNGRLGLHGASAARFLAWASRARLSVGAQTDGAFDLRTALVVDTAHAAARDLTGSLAGTMLRGNAHYKWTGRPELAAALEGPKLDARGLIPAGFNLFDAVGHLARTPFASEAEGRTAAAGIVDLDLRVRAGKLVTAARTYRDAIVVVDMRGGNLKQLQLRLFGDDGYNLELEGSVDNFASRPKGSLRGFLLAETTAGIAPLAELLGVPVAFRPGDRRQRAIVPLRLAGAITFGGRKTTAADLVIDGEANAAAIRINARFDGGTGGWRSGRADLTASIESKDGAKVASLLFPGGAPAGWSDNTGRGRILVRASGIPSEGLASLASLEAGDVGLKFRGQVHVAETGTKAEGDLEVRAGDGTSLAALAGLAPPLRADGVPVSAKLKLALEGSTISIDKLALQAGGTRLFGRVALSEAAGRRRIDANLNADEVTVAGLLSPLLDRQFAAAAEAEAALLGRRSLWPDEPFSAIVLDGFEGQIRLSCNRLTLAQGVTLERARLTAVLHPGKVEVKEIAGAGLGGQFKAALSIDKAPAGTEVRGTLDFDIALEELASGSPPRASGPMKGTIAFTGRGASPRAVMSALQGEGRIAFGEAKLTALWPGAIAAAADAARKADAGKLAETVREALAAGLGTGSLALKQRRLELKIADGQLRSKSLVVDTAEGRTSGTARLDLGMLGLESQWRLEAGPPDTGAAGKPLPAVTVSYRGPIVSLGALDPQIDTTALEQELSARRIEHDMAELERLRRLEEQRRLEEAVRLRKQFEQPPPIPRPPPAPGAPLAPSGREKPPTNPG